MRCPSCGSPAIFRDAVRGEEICTRCGLVILERLPETRREFHEVNICADAGLGEDPSVHDFGLGSQFSVPKELPPSTRAKLRRMRSIQSKLRAPTWEERSLRSALIVINRLCKELGLSAEMKREICCLYRKARSKGLTPGRNHLVLSLALCHIVCRLRGFPRRERDMLELLVQKGIPEDRARWYFRNTLKALCKGLDLSPPRPSAPDYVDRYVSLLNLPVEVASRARQICLGTGLSRSPHVLACAAIYKAAREMRYKLTLRELVRQLQVSISNLSQTVALLENEVRPPADV
jgi:transcription initiation factor TFIIB